MPLQGRITRLIFFTLPLATFFLHVVGRIWENHAENGDFILPKGETLVLQGYNHVQGILSIQEGATLTISPTRNTYLLVNSIEVNGSFAIGNASMPYSHKAVFYFACNTTLSKYDERRKGIVVRRGGSIELFGKKGGGYPAWTKLHDHAESASDCLDFLIPKDWSDGDEIVIASTDYDPHQTERRVIKDVRQNCIQVNRPLNFSHYGRVTERVDQRAEVALLSRNILFYGCHESTKDLADVGGHIMIENGFRKAQIQGIALRNFGQGDKIGRYPIHFHVAGAAPDNTFVRYNAIYDSNFRAITVHGTQNVLVEGNVIFNITGHAVMLEDGAETGSAFKRNCIMLVKQKVSGERLGSDGPAALSAFYITNTRNNFTGNAVAAVEGTGFWIHTRLNVKGLSYATGLYDDIHPYSVSMLAMQNNSVHSSKIGFRIESPDLDSGDEPQQLNYSPPYTYMPTDMPTISNLTMHHLREGGWFRMYRIIVDEWAISDCTEGIQMLTQGNTPTFLTETYISNSIFVGSSDNRGNLISSGWQFINFLENRSESAIERTNDGQMGIKLYDGPVFIDNCTFTHWYSAPCLAYYNPAIGTRQFNTFVMSAVNAGQNLVFEHTDYGFLVTDRVSDGGKTSLLNDIMGDTSGQRNAVLLPRWNFYKTPSCSVNSQFGITCPHRYVNLDVVFIGTSQDRERYGDMIIYRNDVNSSRTASPSLTLEGQYIPISNGWLYHPIISPGASYTLHFPDHTPRQLDLILSSAEALDSFQIAVMYPRDTVLTGIRFQDKDVTRFFDDIGFAECNDCYYFDEEFYFVKLKFTQWKDRSMKGSVCPSDGCVSVRIYADVSGDAFDNEVVSETLSILKVVGSRSSWFGKVFLQENAIVNDVDQVDWCAIADPCISLVDTGNYMQGVMAYHDHDCVGIGCFTSSCRYCKLSHSYSPAPFMPCPFSIIKGDTLHSVTYNKSFDVPTDGKLSLALQDRIANAPTSDKTSTLSSSPSCMELVSTGDLEVGVGAITDDLCSHGGLGCFSLRCRFCRTRETNQSSHFYPCSDSYILNAETSGSTNQNPSDSCWHYASRGDLKIGLTSISDPQCNFGGLGCITESCRFCVVLDSPQANIYPKCQEIARIRKVAVDDGADADTCRSLVSSGDISFGISAKEDVSCSGGGLGCITDNCRLCCSFSSPQSDHLYNCTDLKGGVHESVSFNALEVVSLVDACEAALSTQDKASGLDAFTDYSCAYQYGKDKDCLSSSCRLCQTTPTSDNRIVCPSNAVVAKQVVSSSECASLVSFADSRSGISAHFDESCSELAIVERKYCFARLPCRYCKYRETKRSDVFDACMDHETFTHWTNRDSMEEANSDTANLAGQERGQRLKSSYAAVAGSASSKFSTAGIAILSVGTIAIVVGAIFKYRSVYRPQKDSTRVRNVSMMQFDRHASSSTVAQDLQDTEGLSKIRPSFCQL